MLRADIRVSAAFAIAACFAFGGEKRVMEAQAADSDDMPRGGGKGNNGAKS
jgi:hypothetical protein